MNSKLTLLPPILVTVYDTPTS